MALLGPLGPLEMIVIVVVAILVFGPRLPQVAAEAAHFVGRMKRSLDELRRETGIDREIAEARRGLEKAVPKDVRTMNVAGTLQRKVREAESEMTSLVDQAGREEPDTDGSDPQETETAKEPGSPAEGSPADPKDPGRP